MANPAYKQCIEQTCRRGVLKSSEHDLCELCRFDLEEVAQKRLIAREMEDLKNKVFTPDQITVMDYLLKERNY